MYQNKARHALISLVSLIENEKRKTKIKFIVQYSKRYRRNFSFFNKLKGEAISCWIAFPTCGVKLVDLDS
jgi:hypothetical protein